MKHLSFRNAIIAFLVLATCIASAAIEEDELRGRVVDVDEQAKTVTIHASEVGEALNLPGNSTQTFEVDESTILRDDVHATQLDGLDNIRENDIVRIDFETRNGGRMVARTVSRDGNGTQVAAGQDDRQFAQADQRREQLPATASFWPILALSGFGLWAAALLLRRTRRRS